MLVLVLVAGAAAGYGWYLNHEIHHIDLRNLTSAPVKGDDAGTENILMIGSTDRCALKVQNPAYGLVLAGRQRSEQRRRDDPAPEPGQPLGLDPLHSP